MQNSIVLALGTNLGDRFSNLNRAVRLLEIRGVPTLRRSRLYWTRPLRGLHQPWYLNASILVAARSTPLDLLRICRSVEAEMGRSHAGHWAPRIIDIDLIFFGSFRLDHPELKLPHPAWRDRDFVLSALIDLGVTPPTGTLSDCRFNVARRLSEVEPNIESTSRWL